MFSLTRETDRKIEEMRATQRYYNNQQKAPREHGSGRYANRAQEPEGQDFRAPRPGPSHGKRQVEAGSRGPRSSRGYQHQADERPPHSVERGYNRESYRGRGYE